MDAWVLTVITWLAVHGECDESVRSHPAITGWVILEGCEVPTTERWTPTEILRAYQEAYAPRA